EDGIRYPLVTGVQTCALPIYPILWLLPYCAVCYLCFRRRLYSKSLPILLVSLLYLYFMSKGYVVPIFARAMMLLFPGLCILIGQIGRASCRERVYIFVVGVSF